MERERILNLKKFKPNKILIEKYSEKRDLNNVRTNYRESDE